MILRKDLLLGYSLGNNTAPPVSAEDFIKLQGTANGRSSVLGISESMIQKHVLLMGGTGSGKTNSLKLILPQIQNNMKVLSFYVPVPKNNKRLLNSFHS